MRLLVLWCFVATATLSGCRLFGWGGFSENDDHRDEWASRSNGTYSFVMNRGCFCIPAGLFEVEVVDYEIRSMVQVHSREPVDSTYFEYVHTIEQLFDLIDQARREGADKLEVEYAREGYPTLVSIDWIELAADDELFYGISDVVIAE